MRDGSRGQSIARSARDKLTARNEGKTKHSRLSEVVKLAIEFFFVVAFLFLETGQFYKPLILQGKI